jgi:hypothetical protein
MALGAVHVTASGQSPLQSTVPVVTEARYRLSAKVRLLLFWVGKDNVGGARIRARRGDDGAEGYDLLIGSDPARAPRAINRWGYISEESRAGDATIVGVMKRSDEDSLEAAKSGTANEAAQGIYFKMIQAKNQGGQSAASVTISRAPRDFTYRELGALVDLLLKAPGDTRTKNVALPAGARVGFLSAMAEFLRDNADAVKRDHRAPGRKTLSYAYYGRQYDLTRQSATILSNVTYGETSYPRLVQAEFEVKARDGSSRESFTIVAGIDGAVAGIPVFVSYQPKWWFRADMVLDDRERF